MRKNEIKVLKVSTKNNGYLFCKVYSETIVLKKEKKHFYRPNNHLIYKSLKEMSVCISSAQEKLEDFYITWAHLWAWFVYLRGIYAAERCDNSGYQKTPINEQCLPFQNIISAIPWKYQKVPFLCISNEKCWCDWCWISQSCPMKYRAKRPKRNQMNNQISVKDQLGATKWKAINSHPG